MKKSPVATGVVVALDIVWTGGAWYTGKKLEAHLAEMVTQANDQLRRFPPEAGIELSYQNYQRGVFNSQLQLVVKPIVGEVDSWLKPRQSITLNETVDHGPFPLAQLKSLNLVPAVAPVRMALVSNDVTKPLFDTAKGGSPFVINSRIGYSDDARSDLSLKPLNYKKGDEKVTFSGGEFQLTADKEGNAVSLTGSAQSSVVNAVNEYDQKVQMTFNNLKTEGSNSITSFGERIGDQKLSLDKLSISVEGKELAVLEGMGTDGRSDLINDGKTVSSQLGHTLNSLKLQGQDVGSGKLTLKAGQIDGETLHQFSQQYSAQTKVLITQIGVVQNPELYQQKVTEAFFNVLPILMKGEPIITIAPLNWRNAKGETAFNLSLLLRDPTANTEEPQTPAQEVNRSVKSLDAKLTIPVDMATEFMTQIAKIEGYQQEQAADLTKQQVNGLAAAGQMFRTTTMQDNIIGSSLQYANGQVTLSGQKMPLDEFVGVFGMPSFGEPDVPTIPQQ